MGLLGKPTILGFTPTWKIAWKIGISPFPSALEISDASTDGVPGGG